MQKKILTVALALVTLGLVFPVAAQTTAKIVVPDKVIDLGKVAQGDVREVKFTVKNEGVAELTLKSVRPTCGCTVAEWPKNIAAGGEGVVTAKIDTTGFKGAIAKSIMVMSSDPNNPTITLVIKAVVEPYIEVLPRAIVRFNVLESEEAVEKVIISGTSRSGDFKITGASADSPSLKVEVRRLGENERIEGRTDTQYEVAIHLAKDAEVGPMNSVITVSTTAEQAKEIEIKVFGVVRAMLRVTPPDLQFGSVESRQQPGRNLIIVNNRPDSKMSITEATINDPAFSTDILALEEGQRYQVTVTVKKDAVPGIKDAMLVLKTTDAVFKELRVPVRANVR